MYNKLNIMGGEKYCSDDYKKIEKDIKDYLMNLHVENLRAFVRLKNIRKDI